MLDFESEGFLEVEDLHIEELYRSVALTSLTAPDGTAFELHAVLCLHRADASTICQVAFYCRALKRALIFGSRKPAVSAEVEAIRALLESLGFPLEQVKLNLSPALRQVVLRDIVGLQTPAAASRLRSEKVAQMAALESILQHEEAGSEAAKKARHNLNVERRQDARASVLRNLLEAKLAGAERADAKLQQLAAQVGDLTVRLERAVALGAEERRQREQAETIRASAEKRIQELEEILVGLETKTAAAMKSQAKSSQLNKRVKELQGELAEALEQIDKESAEKLRLAAELAGRAARDEVNVDLLARAEAAVRAAQACNEQLRADNAHLHSSAADLSRELQAAQSRIAAMEQELAAAGASSLAVKQAAARESEQWRLHLAALEQRLVVAESAAGQERILRTDLEARAAADRARIGKLEQTLVENLGKLESKEAKSKAPARKLRSDNAPSEAALGEALAAVQQERLAREDAEKALDDAHRLIDALENALKSSRDKTVAAPQLDVRHPDDERLVDELSAKLRMVEAQLAQEVLEGRKTARAYANAERRLAVLDEQLHQLQNQPPLPPAAICAASGNSAGAGARGRPHELRPAPASGALFHPDWDLTGLPCDSAAQVLQAWESLYNVQLALEGYPSQYCAAFLVLLKEGGQQRLYLLYSLKKDRHTLVCVPGKLPRDEAALKKLLEEGQKYLQRSGFEMAKMPVAEVSNTLGAYFRKTGG